MFDCEVVPESLSRFSETLCSLACPSFSRGEWPSRAGNLQLSEETLLLSPSFSFSFLPFTPTSPCPFSPVSFSSFFSPSSPAFSPLSLSPLLVATESPVSLSATLGDTSDGSPLPLSLLVEAVVAMVLSSTILALVEDGSFIGVGGLGLVDFGLVLQLFVPVG